MSIFTKVQNTKLRHNVFDLSHEKKLSTVMGKITPVACIDLVPGDKISIKSSVFIRFAPMVYPVMHQVNAYIHYFFVPNRILWENWEKFITGGEFGNDNSVHPYINLDLANIGKGSLTDYLGLPLGTDVGAPGDVPVNAFPFAVYQKIYQDYYRDENLIAEQPLSWTLGDGENDTQFRTGIKNRAWQHDYFTSALPFTQKGPEALLPLGTEAPIFTRDFAEMTDPFVTYNRSADGTQVTGVSGDILYGSALNPVDTNSEWVNLNNPGQDAVYFDLGDTHAADLTQATSASIIDVRRAFRLQEYLEKNARGGTRYKEWIQVHFGWNTSDGRLQRAEYFGGFSAPVKISEVLSTAPGTDPNSPQLAPLGTMGGHGLGVGQGGYASWTAEEHGYVMACLSVMPRTAYQNGIPKHFLRKDKFDYFTPEFQHIGEQPIEYQELYVNGTQSNEDTFGYTPRYVEYKYICNSVAGDFRDTLDQWHMGRKFADTPQLNSDFIEMDDAEVNRIFAIDPNTTGSDTLWIHVLNNVKASRPMAVFGNPKF